MGSRLPNRLQSHSAQGKEISGGGEGGGGSGGGDNGGDGDEGGGSAGGGGFVDAINEQSCPYHSSNACWSHESTIPLLL